MELAIELASQAMSLLFVAIAGYVTVFLRNVSKTIKSHTVAIVNDEQRKIAVNALDRVKKLTAETVESIEVTIAKDLREQVKSGEADFKELKELSNEALEQIKIMLEPGLEQALKETVNDIDSYIGILIETQLEKLKREIY